MSSHCKHPFLWIRAWVLQESYPCSVCKHSRPQKQGCVTIGVDGLGLGVTDSLGLGVGLPLGLGEGLPLGLGDSIFWFRISFRTF